MTTHMAKKKPQTIIIAPKRAVGRPKEGLESLPDGWQLFILDMYKTGASDVEIKAQIHSWRGAYSDGLFERWLKDEPEFSSTIKLGREFAHAWWLNIGRVNILQSGFAPKFNTALWFINMKNRYGWADKVDARMHTTNEQVFTLKIE